MAAPFGSPGPLAFFARGQVTNHYLSFLALWVAAVKSLETCDLESFLVAATFVTKSLGRLKARTVALLKRGPEIFRVEKAEAIAFILKAMDELTAELLSFKSSSVWKLASSGCIPFVSNMLGAGGSAPDKSKVLEQLRGRAMALALALPSDCGFNLLLDGDGDIQHADKAF
jgi:hypothetical protein